MKRDMNRNVTILIVLIISISTLIGLAAVTANAIIINMQSSTNIIKVGIYRKTEAWKLAKAVEEEDTKRIEKILKEKPELVNFQEPKYGITLLLWAVGMEKYDSCETLLKCGADTDIASTKDGTTPIYLASGKSWLDKYTRKDYDEDPKFVKLLLSYGADPNKIYNGSKRDSDNGKSPLINSIGMGFEKTKALVEAGADINYKTETGNTAAIQSLKFDFYIDYAEYLIVEKKAKVNEPYYMPEADVKDGDDPDKEFYPVDCLRQWVFDLESDDYKRKMAIVDEFANQGVDYWSREIPDEAKEWINSIYRYETEIYFEKY